MIGDEVGQDVRDLVCIYHWDPGKAAGEGNSSVGNCVYRKVVLERGRGAGGLPPQGAVDLRKALSSGS